MESKLCRIVLWDSDLANNGDDLRAFINKKGLQIGKKYEFIKAGIKPYKNEDRAVLYSATRAPNRKIKRIGIIELSEIAQFGKGKKSLTIGKYRFLEIYDTERKT